MSFAVELQAIATRLTEVAAPARDPEFLSMFEIMLADVDRCSAAWSGSNVAEHSSTYFEDFRSPPPDLPFSRHLSNPAPRSSAQPRSRWSDYPRDQVRALVFDPVALRGLRRSADAVRQSLEDARWEIDSLLSAFLADHDDRHTAALREAVTSLSAPTADELTATHLAERQVALSTDIRWAGRALRAAPHEEVSFELQEVHLIYRAADEMAQLASRAATHLDRIVMNTRVRTGRPSGSRVFIGHGGSPLWRELKEFLTDQLGLAYDEFNRVPVAGRTTIARLNEMLDDAVFAFLVLTAEDERADGSLVARQNVIHEAGLFQGRLGFDRAILLVEEGCASFSNVAGLTAIEFRRSDLSAAFEKVRRVLHREGLTGP